MEGVFLVFFGLFWISADYYPTFESPPTRLWDSGRKKKINDAFVGDCICICIYKYTNQQQKPCGVLAVLRLIFHVHCYVRASDH